MEVRDVNVQRAEDGTYILRAYFSSEDEMDGPMGEKVYTADTRQALIAKLGQLFGETGEDYEESTGEDSEDE